MIRTLGLRALDKRLCNQAICVVSGGVAQFDNVHENSIAWCDSVLQPISA